MLVAVRLDKMSHSVQCPQARPLIVAASRGGGTPEHWTKGTDKPRERVKSERVAQGARPVRVALLRSLGHGATPAATGGRGRMPARGKENGVARLAR